MELFVEMVDFRFTARDRNPLIRRKHVVITPPCLFMYTTPRYDVILLRNTMTQYSRGYLYNRSAACRLYPWPSYPIVM